MVRTLLFFMAAVASGATAHAAGPPANHRVSLDDRPRSFRSATGDTDPILNRCSTGRRPQTEAGAAIDPSRDKIVVVGGHTVCPDISVGVGFFDLGWAGIYRSRDGGRTFRASLVPGYPGDTSPQGLASPAHGMKLTAEHAVAFDRHGRLFYAFLACSRPRQSSCRDFVATYDRHGSRYRGTAALSSTSPPPGSGIEEGFGEWTSIAVDNSGGPHDGTVYVTWNAFKVYAEVDGLPEQTAPVSATVMSRSTDHGRTWSPPVPVGPPLGVAYTTDVTVGPDGAVYVAARHIGQTGPIEDLSAQVGGTDAVTLVRSTDGGRTFGLPALVARFRAFDQRRYTGGGRAANPGVCGDGYFSCDLPYTVQDDNSNAVVVADRSGVHVFFNARQGPAGQSKVMVRSSPDGVHFPEPERPLDTVPTGHQNRVEAATDGRRITVAFTDSRADRFYAPDRPWGNDAEGHSPGGFMDLWAAQSTDGGKTWTERRVSSVTTNANLEVHEFGRVAFNGDYVGVAAVPGRTYVTWTDNRDVVTAVSDPRFPGDDDGNDTHLPCAWAPADPLTRTYSSPGPHDPCLAAGGLDQNLYGARL